MYVDNMRLLALLRGHASLRSVLIERMTCELGEIFDDWDECTDNLIFKLGDLIEHRRGLLELHHGALPVLQHASRPLLKLLALRDLGDRAL